MTAQGVAALVLAVLVNVFHRHYGKAYLRHWASSWWALAVFILATFLLRNADLERADTLLLLGVQGVAGYLNIGMLALGFWELIKGRPARTPFVRWFVAGLVAGGALLSAGVALISWEGALANVFALRAFVASAVFVPMALWMFRRRLHESGIGVILAAGSLFVYGLHQVQYAGYHLFGRAPGYALLLGYGEILLLVLLGFGMVSCLLEEERRAAFLATQQIEHVAYHDALTGLPNRPLFLDRLIVALAQAARYDYKLAVFFLDVDHFKDINDTLGHSHGDALLKEISARIRRCVRSSDTVSRFGGDEFTILVQYLERVEDIARIAQKLLDAVKQPVRIGEHELFVSVSVGISFYPVDGTEPETLLKNADAAMYRAKEQGRDSYQIYAPAMNATAIERLSLENQLRRALENEELEVYYQPLIEIGTGAIFGAEALLRWRRPEGEVAGPPVFLRTLETSGLILPVGDWVLARACRDAVEWDNAGAKVGVSVNLAPRQFLRTDLAQRVRAILEETGLEPGRLELEITEDCAMQNAENSIRALRELKAIGVRLGLDDFGTGYSSLNYLKRFPIDTLKLDKSFVQDVNEDQGDAAIAVAVISMAKSLGLTLVAEGIETEEQLAFFRERGCPRGQGYLFGRPMPLGEFATLLRERPTERFTPIQS